MNPQPAITPWNIVYVFVRLERGGAERHLLSVLRHLDRARFAPQVLCLAQRGPLAEDVEKLGVPLVCLGLHPCRLWTPTAQARIAGWMRAQQIHVAHTHMFHANCYGRLAALLAGVPARVISVHNTTDAAWHRHTLLLRLLDRFTCRTIAVSEAVRQSLIASGRYDARRIEVVLNGVEMAPVPVAGQRAALRAKLKLLAEDRVIIMVARMVPLKRHADLLTAAAALGAEFKDVQLLFVGDGPLRGALEAQALRLGLENRAHFLGMRADVDELLVAADLAVLPSENEGLGLAILEAMMAGLPVVASRVGGILEVVTPDTGSLFPAGDIAALRAELKILLIDNSRRLRLGAAGLRRAQELFSAATMTRRLEEIYSACLHKPGTIPPRERQQK